MPACRRSILLPLLALLVLASPVCRALCAVPFGDAGSAAGAHAAMDRADAHDHTGVHGSRDCDREHDTLRADRATGDTPMPPALAVLPGPAAIPRRPAAELSALPLPPARGSPLRPRRLLTLRFLE